MSVISQTPPNGSATDAAFGFLGRAVDSLTQIAVARISAEASAPPGTSPTSVPASALPRPYATTAAEEAALARTNAQNAMNLIAQFKWPIILGFAALGGFIVWRIAANR